MTRVRRLRPYGSLLIVALFWPSAAPATELEEAVSLTAAGDLAGAERVYRSFAETHPQEGLPALGRFLSLAGDPGELEDFLDSIQKAPNLTVDLHARILLQAGRTDEALNQLRIAIGNEADPAVLRFAAGVFARAGAAEAGHLYLRLLRAAQNADEAHEALSGLLSYPEAVGAADLAALAPWLLEADLPAEERLAFLDAVVKTCPSPETDAPPKTAFESLLHSVRRFGQGDDQGALASAPESLSRDPSGSLWAVQRIRSLHRQGATEEAGRIAAWLLAKERPASPDRAVSDDAPAPIYAALDGKAPEAEAQAILLIQDRPYDPEPMRRLMRFYKETGRGDPASVPALVSQGATNPQLIGQCGYVLATEGFPTQALVEYDRALALDSADPFLRMNRAACLTRLERWEEAQAVYRNLLEVGHRGRPYHIHELILRLWVIAEARSEEAACLAYFESLLSRPLPTGSFELARDLAGVMRQLQRPSDAERFELLKPSPASP